MTSQSYCSVSFFWVHPNIVCLLHAVCLNCKHIMTDFSRILPGYYDLLLIMMKSLTAQDFFIDALSLITVSSSSKLEYISDALHISTILLKMACYICKWIIYIYIHIWIIFINTLHISEPKPLQTNIKIKDDERNALSWRLCIPRYKIK